MARYLIEVSHDDGPHACEDAVKALLHTGAHFMVKSEWGCRDDVHSAWLIVDAENKDELKLIIPPHFRPEVRIVELARYSQVNIDDQNSLVTR
jgi:hypothetical protein